jgi:2-dehydro-3-deoxygluconokinase
MTDRNGSAGPNAGGEPFGLSIPPGDGFRWDLLALGEVMLRLDPGEERIATTRNFRVWEGGGEYNVARALRRCFGMKTSIVTALVDNPVGRLLEDLMLQGGVDLSHVLWRPSDGIGRTVRNPLNFTERGFGLRAALSSPDRGHSASSQLAPGQIDWEKIFGEERVRWFHCGGIFAGLSESSGALAEEAMSSAKSHGVVVSYDLNYRDSLWRATGGKPRAREVNRRLARLVDVLIGNEEDFVAALGCEVDDLAADYSSFAVPGFERMLAGVQEEYPNIKVLATTLRCATTASRNDWTAIGYSGGNLVHGPLWPDLEIFDRVGGGDGFASGLIYGLINGMSLELAVKYGTAHGALAMTTPGDTCTARLGEVERVLAGGTARISR